MSGYVAENSRRLTSGAPFLAKPFSPDALAGMVRWTLAEYGVVPLADAQSQDSGLAVEPEGSNR
jgi:hypothetical protein